MESVKINVNKSIDGYTFSMTPSTRSEIKSEFPDAMPANSIFVAYDTKSDFQLYVGNLESYIFPALVGLSIEKLKKKIKSVVFIDPVENKELQKFAL